MRNAPVLIVAWILSAALACNARSTAPSNVGDSIPPQPIHLSEEAARNALRFRIAYQTSVQVLALKDSLISHQWRTNTSLNAQLDTLNRQQQATANVLTYTQRQLATEQTRRRRAQLEIWAWRIGIACFLGFKLAGS